MIIKTRSKRYIFRRNVMLKPKIIFLLYLFLFIATFFSCGDVVDPLKDKIGISDLSFAKVSLKVSVYAPGEEEIKSFPSVPITECMVGDTISLMCRVWPGYTESESITVRITTLKGDKEFIELFYNPYLLYIQSYEYIVYLLNEDMYPNLPEQLLLSHIPIRFESNPVVGNNILSVSPDGDIIKAEIKNKNQTQTAILNIRSK